MSPVVVVLLLFLLLCLLVLGEMYREQHRFCVTHYEVHAARFPELDGKIVFLSDLHNHVYGRKNEELLEAVKAEQPDLILIGGDMLVGKEEVRYQEALDLVRQLPKLCPVYYASGNHEQRIKENPGRYSLDYEDYRKELQACGVHFLENESCEIPFGKTKIRISGLELPLRVNKKFQKAHVTKEEITTCLKKKCTADRYQILLAHNPSYMEAYKDWGADLILSGHLHGGCVRLPVLGGVITPQGFLFPKYSGEMTVEGQQTMIVSKGLGTHTFNVRLWNPAEVVSIHFNSSIPSSDRRK